MLVSGGVDKKGLNDHSNVNQNNKSGQRAYEYYRTSQNISPIPVRVSGTERLGLEVLRAVWEHGDGQVGRLCAASVVFGGAAPGVGAAA